MHFVPIQDFFHKNMHVIKKKVIFDRKVFKLQRFSKVFPNVGGNTLFYKLQEQFVPMKEIFKLKYANITKQCQVC